jgi:quercetin dioxygenase-like cupin family protein
MKTISSVLITLTAIAGVSAVGVAADTIVRKSLLTANLATTKQVDRVDIREIDFVARQKTGLHLHPSPVVGYIASGSILFQVEGQPQQTLKAGDAFFEPANTRVLHFDAIDQPVKFIAYYLLGKDDKELIRNLE